MMILQKTAKGREAIHTRCSQLNARERRLIILADGKLTTSDLACLTGDDTQHTLNRLLAEGYLIASEVHAAPVTQTQAPAPGSVTTQPPTPPQPAPDEEAVLTRSRRSLAATKLYMIDILHLVRSPDAAAHRLAIHTSRSADEVIEAVLKALHFIDAYSGRAYADKVHQQLQVTVPEEHLPRLDILRNKLAAA